MKIVVWGLPTRLFHWLFVLAFVVARLTADSDRYRDVHVFAGYLIFRLLLFRFVWGFVGSRYARFSSFFFGPARGFNPLGWYRIATWTTYLGHNPAGACAIHLLLALALAVSVTGILVLGGEEQHGMFGGITTLQAVK